MVLPLRTAGRSGYCRQRILESPGGAGAAIRAFFCFAEKLVVRGARLRNKSAAQESTRGFRSALQPTVRSARGTFRELVFMSARQKRPKTAVDQCLSILFLETANFRLQLYELNKLRYRVRQAELSARDRAQAHSGARGRNPHQRPSQTRHRAIDFYPA